MNSDTLQGQWKQLKGQVRQKWGKLTDDEIDQVNGSYERLVGILQEKYGLARENAEKLVNDWK